MLYEVSGIVVGRQDSVRRFTDFTQAQSSKQALTFIRHRFGKQSLLRDVTIKEIHKQEAAPSYAQLSLF